MKCRARHALCFLFIGGACTAREDFNTFVNNCNMQEANAEQKEEDGSRDDATIHRGLLPASKHSRTYAKLLRRWLGHTYAVMMINTKNLAATSSELHVTRRM